MANWSDRYDDDTAIKVFHMRLFRPGERIVVVYPSEFGGPAMTERGTVLECVGGRVRVQPIGSSKPISPRSEWVRPWEAK